MWLNKFMLFYNLCYNLFLYLKPMALEQVMSDRDSEDEVDDDIADFEDRRVWLMLMRIRFSSFYVKILINCCGT